MQKNSSFLVSERSSSSASGGSDGAEIAHRSASYFNDDEEVILKESSKRYCVRPIQYQDLYDMYSKQTSCFWLPGEANFELDRGHFEKLTKDEQYFVENVLAFFAASDGIVNENLALRFTAEVKITEASMFYASQMQIEAIHADSYSLMIEMIIDDPDKRARLFDAIHTVPCVKKKADWALKWISSERPFVFRLLAFMIVEGIFFAGSFASIFWLRKRGLMPGLAFLNEMISRDESLHAEFAVKLMAYLKHRPSYEEVLEIMLEAVAIEVEFMTEALPCKLLGMNAESMISYIKYIADFWLKALGFPSYFKDPNPFDFMDLISLEGKTNFFEKRVGEYQKSGAINKGASDKVFSLTEDF